ncbi:DNA damage-inducible transcript 4 protein [Amazona aestiva]|uniref:DNA damage-inducible transcript 4 protein n=1 Tax=Amazona aestiva TaxID=12930 RepID=A0A0Q3M0B4_AMAAE|nr:DNA damage-inducible transcript 4 protein [Amazona aestiva]
MHGLWHRLAGGEPGRLETSDCESLGSASGSEGDAEYADGVSLPDLDLLHDPEDELLCANLMDLVQTTLGRAPLGAKRCSRLLMPAQLLAQLTLVLRLDSRLWPKIQGLFTSGPAFTPLKLSTGFRIIKKKLYSSEQLLIEEC